MGAPSSQVTSSDEWNRMIGRIWAKASWRYTVRLHEVRLAAAEAPVPSGSMGHLARQMAVILRGVGGTPEEVRWLISKYNLKRILKYTENKGKSELQIDYNEIKSKKDRYGFFILFTEHLGLSAEGVLAIYKSQQIVKEGFRALKSDMRIDPVYHSKDMRIETHNVMVVLGYLMMSILQAILVRKGIKHSFGELSETIRSGNVVEGFYECEASLQAT